MRVDEAERGERYCEGRSEAEYVRGREEQEESRDSSIALCRVNLQILPSADERDKSTHVTRIEQGCFDFSVETDD